MSRHITNEELYEKLEKLEISISPIIETYKTVERLGSWAKIVLAFLALVITIVLGVKGIAK